MTDSPLQEKLDRLKDRLRGHGSVAVSLSGGVDSSLLLKVAVDALGANNVLALTARSANFPQREYREAADLAQALGVRHVTLDWEPMRVAEFRGNEPDRCYHCKRSIFTQLGQAAEREGVRTVLDGSNLDDQGDYRPGRKATRELGVHSPLEAEGLGKADIRALCRELGLAVWDKPSFACLASRFPFGQEITPGKLAMLERAEDYLLRLGFRQVRVRFHGDAARIEVGADERRRFFDEKMMDRVGETLKSFGFVHVALDLAGYRMGSMNAIPVE